MGEWREPRPDGAWITPRGVAAVVEELELCGVPLDATAASARCRLELNGVWVSYFMANMALRVRREAAGFPSVGSGQHRSCVPAAGSSSLAA
ncbi:hypothetical protein ABT023_18805 [Micromonospora sp. NPDC002296]|uniref:hypothetical protein n=1 Tax=Micromonospora sp. NPDC002296 TaxID=3154271 RepID=UPI00332C83CF